MGYNYQLPQSPHLVTIKKKLTVPIPVQLENNPNEGAYQYLSKHRKHYLQSLDGILLSWNTHKIRLKSKGISPYFQARVSIKGEFTVLRIKTGDKLTATVIDLRPSAIVARALENFLVFIEVQNLEVLCRIGDEVSFTYESYEWEDMNPVIYGNNPNPVHSSAGIIRRPVLQENNSQKLPQQPTISQQKRKIVAQRLTQIENESKKRKVDDSQPPNPPPQPPILIPQPPNLTSQPPKQSSQPPNLTPQPPRQSSQTANQSSQQPNLSSQTVNQSSQPPNQSSQPPNLAHQPQRSLVEFIPILGLRIPAQQKSSESSKTSKKSSIGLKNRKNSATNAAATSEASVGKDGNTEKDATDQESSNAPSTSVAEVDNTEEIVESRPQSVQDNMDAVDTNNEPRDRLNENMTYIECDSISIKEEADIKVEPETLSLPDENIQPTVLEDRDTLSSVVESQAPTEIATAVAKATFRRILPKVSSSQPTINEPIQAAEASSTESTTSLLTVLSPSTINTVRTSSTPTQRIFQQNEISSPRKSAEEVPPGWTRRFHATMSGRKYYTFISPIGRSFKSLKSAWKYHQAMMNESIAADAQNDECEEVTGENTDDMVETNKDNPEETEATATSAMPVDDDSNQEVVIKCETSDVAIEDYEDRDYENRSKEVNTVSTSSPVLKKTKERSLSSRNPPSQYFENKIKLILMEANILYKTGKEGPRKRTTSESRPKSSQKKRTESESSVEILDLNKDRRRKEAELVLIDDSSSEEFQNNKGGDGPIITSVYGDGHGPVTASGASVDELLEDSDAEIPKTQAKKNSLPKVIQGKELKNLLKKKKKKDKKIIKV